MQKSVADKLVKSPDHNCWMAVKVSELLRRPKKNHTDFYTPMIERFVFDGQQVQCLNDACINLSRNSKDALFASLKLPMHSFWMEFGQSGYYVSGETVTLFNGSGKKVPALASASVSQIMAAGPGTDFTAIFRPDDGRFWDCILDDVGGHFRMFAALCAAINSPRSATTERVRRVGGSTVERKAVSRRGQRGYPIFSFNRVNIHRPDTSSQKSEVLLSGVQTSKRGHWVIGHWRLIDGNAEPYWTWVESHKRGDDGLGFIAHERLVDLAPGSFGVRRGFSIPAMPGSAGSKIEAVRV